MKLRKLLEVINNPEDNNSIKADIYFVENLDPLKEKFIYKSEEFEYLIDCLPNSILDKEIHRCYAEDVDKFLIYLKNKEKEGKKIIEF